MNDPPLLQPAIGHRAARGAQLRSTSDSPTRQRLSDDLISRLTPRTAVDAFRNPSGALKRCMDAASPSEQAFAMRVAVASQNIQEWLEELYDWPWPTDDTSAGFERPPAKRRKLFSQQKIPDDGHDRRQRDETHDESFLGSLPAIEVARYERRIHEIQHELEELDIEEIKRQVLHNHIMPLSRPGTPMSDGFRSSTLSASAYARMDDFTALITATIVQALPNLSKLTRLLNTWSIRLLVLQKSPGLLMALMDAEVALQAGRKAMDSHSDKNPNGIERGDKPTTSNSVLSRSDFSIMKSILERKVAKAGQYLDYMLDVLEGCDDTLPDDWIDRMDSIESEYAEWVAACERQIRDSEWAKIVRQSPVTGTRDSTNAAESPTTRLTSPESLSDDKKTGSGAVYESTNSPEDFHSENGTADHLATTDVTTRPYSSHGPAGDEHAQIEITDVMASPPVIMVHPADEDTTESTEQNQEQRKTASPSIGSTEGLSKPETEELSEGAKDGPSRFDRMEDIGLPVVAEVLQPVSESNVVCTAPNTAVPAGVSESIPCATDQTTVMSDSDMGQKHLVPVNDGHSGDNDDDADIDFPDSEYPEPELPVLPQLRRGSEVSETATVVHGPQSGLADFSSDAPDQGTPDYHRLRDAVMPSTEGSDDIDIPSSPPNFRSSTRSLSVSFNDIPTVVEAPEEGTPPETPLDVSFADDDDIPGEVDRPESPGKMSAVSSDDQLQQQISEILESIPAKIRLASEPSAVNLNPPDFSMPTTTRPKAKPDPFPRSYSSMSSRSSRAGTPSFTLAPAKNSRPRHQRGNQEIKLYHLSRSNGEAPIKLLIRCVGENGERVMVRVGGGWADLGEYLKEYASHHGRRGGESKVEIRDLPRISTASRAGSSPPSRPASAMDMSSPVTPLNVRKARRSIGASASEELKPAVRQPLPKTPLANSATAPDNNTPSSGASTRSRSSSRLSWTEDDISLGMAGPKAKHVEMSEENKAWVESVKEKVRIASGDQRAALGKSPAVARAATPDPNLIGDGKFGELGKVGTTKRLFRRQGGPGTGPGPGPGLGVGK